MKKFLYSIFGALMLLAASPTYAADFIFKQLDSAIEIRTDGLIEVTESITVDFPFEKHGIYRDIPVVYKSASGNRVTIGLEVISVLRDGEYEDYEELKEGDNLRVKIGNAAQVIKGRHNYEIKYRVDRALRGFSDHDELYWNVTGNEWPTAPESVTATVILPEGVDHAALKAVCYTGSYGSTAQDCTATIDSKKNQLSFEGRDFMTITAGWNKGVVKVPTTLELWTRLLLDNWIFAIPIGFFLILYAIWYVKGRDPKNRSIVPEYAPPDGFLPAELGTLYDTKVHDSDLAATIVDLAVRGYLKIIESEDKGLIGTSKSFTLKLLDKSQNDLKDYEKNILTGVFGSASERRLSELSSRAKEMSTNRKSVETILYKEMATKGYFVSNPETVRGGYVGVAVFLGIGATWLIGGNFPALWIVLVICSIMLGLFGLIMPKRTMEGQRLYEQTLGFKEYLEKAEKYRMQWQEKEHIFEKFLPYAMAFGVVDAWTNALKDVIQPMDWYQSSSGSWNPVMFHSGFNDFNRSLRSGLTVNPKNSAAGGGSGFSGGFSGGGFGGGGGGSW